MKYIWRAAEKSSECRMRPDLLYRIEIVVNESKFKIQVYYKMKNIDSRFQPNNLNELIIIVDYCRVSVVQ
jgi:hypothetical protein